MGFDLEMFLNTLVKQGFIRSTREVDQILDRQDFALLIPVLVKMHNALKAELGVDDCDADFIKSRIQGALTDNPLGGYAVSKEVH